MNTRNLIRWAGLSAMVAGICFVVVGLLHPPNILSSVTTTRWVIVHAVAIAMSLFGLLGITGLYARQAQAAGWLGLAGYLLFSLWLVLIFAFTFVEVFILPLLATDGADICGGLPGDLHRVCRRDEPRRACSASGGSPTPCFCSAACCLASRRSAPASCRAGRPAR